MPVLFVLHAAFQRLRMSTRHIVYLVATVTTVIAVSWTVYVAMRIRVTYASQRQIVQLANDLSALRESTAVYQHDMAMRLNELERRVYGVVPQAPTPGRPRPSVSPQPWQVNRDEELRRRLQALEQRDVQRDDDLRKRFQALEAWMRTLSRRDKNDR